MPLQNFHLRMEAFGDAVVPGEAPHQGNFRLPRAQSLPQLDELSQTGVAQLVQGVQKLADKRDGLFARAVLDEEQVGKFLLEAVDLTQDGGTARSIARVWCVVPLRFC